MIIALDPADPARQIDEAALVATLSHLRADMRGHESVARHGVSCFAVLLEKCDADQAASAGERFVARVAEPLPGVPAMRARVGAVLAPDRGRTAAALLRCAEEALTVARLPGSRRYVLYDHDAMRSPALADGEGVDAIVAAINQGRIGLALQPIVCARTRQPIRYDALLQIIRMDGSPMPADAIPPAATGSGLGPLLDQRVLDLAFAMLARDRSLRLSITLELASLAEPALIDHLRVACRLRPDAARRLTIGISEHDVIAELETTRRALAQIKPLGVSIAIDDVGTVASSLHALRLLTIDVLTIDGAAGEPLIRTLTNLGHELTASIVAKRIGDAATADRLANWGVTCLQGDLFGRHEAPGGPSLPIAATG